MNKYGDKYYYSLDYFYKNKYKSKVFKICLNQGLTCPNIDGTKGYGGCIYCHEGSSDFGGNKSKCLSKQFEDIKKLMHKKWKEGKYIAYFQANTNTYGDFKQITDNFEEVIKYNGVVGINVGTRCDCLNTKWLDYFSELNKKTDLIIELGLQSIHDKTLKMLNTCYTLDEFYNTYKELKNRNIKVVVHVINGLPNETKEMMLNTVKYLNKLKIDGIKIHMLSIQKNTQLEKMYKDNNFSVLSKEEYVDIVVSQLELLNKNIVIHRLTGDPDSKQLIEPEWIIKKFCVLNDISKEQKNRNSWQGKKDE